MELVAGGCPATDAGTDEDIAEGAVAEPSDEYMFMAMLAAVTHRMSKLEKANLLMQLALLPYQGLP